MFNIWVFFVNVMGAITPVRILHEGVNDWEVEKTGQYGPFGSREEAYRCLEENGWKKLSDVKVYHLPVDIGPSLRHDTLYAMVISATVRSSEFLPRR
jgi:hypothetical protein